MRLIVTAILIFLFSNYGCFEDGIERSLKENKFLVTNISLKGDKQQLSLKNKDLRIEILFPLEYEVKIGDILELCIPRQEVKDTSYKKDDSQIFIGTKPLINLINQD